MTSLAGRRSQPEESVLPYEDETRSVEGPDASRGGPKEPAPFYTSRHYAEGRLTSDG